MDRTKQTEESGERERASERGRRREGERECEKNRGSVRRSEGV